MIRQEQVDWQPELPALRNSRQPQRFNRQLFIELTAVPTMPDIPHIFDLTPDELGELIVQADMPRYCTKQILEWVYHRLVVDPAAMTNLSGRHRQWLAANIGFLAGTVMDQRNASDGTKKLLISWSGMLTECVLIPANEDSNKNRGRSRRTACISSQIGCPVGCRFCASGLGGLEGNLTAGQIVEQVWHLSRLSLDGAARPAADNPSTDSNGHSHSISSSGSHVSHVVFMGMGEPLVNFDAVVRAVRTLTAKWAFGISARRITISTVGLPAQIRKLAEIDLPLNLAISLHAPNDQLRQQLIPWARTVSISQILEAARNYFNATGREITLEYLLLGGMNDQPVHAHQLAQVAGRLRANVNLIRYNEVPPLPFNRPLDDDVLVFQKLLRQAGINTHIRTSRGRDIAAACGQLRHEITQSHRNPEKQP